jgi:hypothetical protein
MKTVERHFRWEGHDGVDRCYANTVLGQTVRLIRGGNKSLHDVRSEEVPDGDETDVNNREAVDQFAQL